MTENHFAKEVQAPVQQMHVMGRNALQTEFGENDDNENCSGIQVIATECGVVNIYLVGDEGLERLQESSEKWRFRNQTSASSVAEYSLRRSNTTAPASNAAVYPIKTTI